jgi:hypothetical protein
MLGDPVPPGRQYGGVEIVNARDELILEQRQHTRVRSRPRHEPHQIRCTTPASAANDQTPV